MSYELRKTKIPRYQDTKKLVFWCSGVLVFWCSTILAESFDKTLESGIRYSYEERYEEAEREFIKVIKSDTYNPVGYFFLSSLYGLYMSDFSTDTLQHKFYAYIDTTIQKAKNILNKDKDNASAHLYLGAAYGARALYRIQKKNYLDGISDGVTGIKEFSKAVDLDSTLYDAYIGLATYDYFKYKFLSLLPFVTPDDKWEQEIKTAIDKGNYLRISAMSGYALLLEQEQRYEDAIKIAKEVISLFPDSRTFRWILAKLYMGNKDWNNAEQEFKILLDLTIKGQPENVYNISACRDGLAKVYFIKGELKKCNIQCEEILKLDGDSRLKAFHKRAKKRITP